MGEDVNASEGASEGASNGASNGFEYDNEPDRPPGRFVSLAGLVLPGVARVQAQAAPFAAAWSRSNTAALQRTGPLWVALGDSLTQGLGAPAFDRGWVGQLHDRLTSAGTPMRLVNLSVTGARTQDVIDRQLPALAELERHAGAPELVTLMIGSNDLVSRAHRAGIGSRMASIVAALPAGSLVTTLPNPTAAAAEANAAVRAAADRLIVADLRDPRTTSWRGKLADDHFHPNERGYAALTGVIAAALARAWGIPLPAASGKATEFRQQ